MSQIFVIVDIQLGIEIHFLILKVYIQMVYLSESKKASGIIDKGGFLCVIVKSENWLLFLTESYNYRYNFFLYRSNVFNNL